MDPRTEVLSEGAGEYPAFVGELEWEDGVGRVFFGDVAEECGCIGGGTELTDSALGAILGLDLRDWWCLFMMARWIGGGWTMFGGTWVGPRFGLPVLARSSACTSMPVSVFCQLCDT